MVLQFMALMSIPAVVGRLVSMHKSCTSANDNQRMWCLSAGTYSGCGTAPAGPAFSIGSRPAAKQPSLPAVGPGAYDMDTGLSTGPAFSIGARVPGMDEVSVSRHVPGPGAYNVTAAQAGNKGPAWTMGAKAAEATAGRTGCTGAIQQVFMLCSRTLSCGFAYKYSATDQCV